MNDYISDTDILIGSEYNYPAEDNSQAGSYAGYGKETDYPVSPPEESVVMIMVSQDEIMVSIFLYMVLIFIMPITVLVSFMIVLLNPGKRGVY